MKTKRKTVGPRVLFLDIETAPLLGYVWTLWNNNLSLGQVHSDWYVLSWAAKWLGESKVMYADQRAVKNMEDDAVILQALWNLVDAADIIVTQNGKKFDQKKINARFVIHGFPPPSPVKHIDTMLIAKKNFGFTSNKLEYMADKLCTKYKKLKHAKYAGFELWTQCLARNPDAWREMEKYNRHDVLVLEELYHVLRPWHSGINFNWYHNELKHVCQCGSSDCEKRGFHYTVAAKYQRYQCRKCGSWTRSRENLFSQQKRASLRTGNR